MTFPPMNRTTPSFSSSLFQSLVEGSGEGWWANATSEPSNISYYYYDPCVNFEDKVANLSDSLHTYPRYFRPLIMTLYICVACFGAMGNLLVVVAVVRNPQMRIPRNYFIINLAFSDFLMCTVTVPFTMKMTLNTFWSMGRFTCKFVSTLQGINLFVSTMSMTAIGFDRYWVILFPTKTNQQRVVILICFIAIWTLSLVFASPMFSATTLRVIPHCGYELIVCAEDWNTMPFSQVLYSMGCIVFQYLLPLTMLTFLYSRIIWRLKGRMVFARQSSQYDDGRRRSVESRQRRTNILLVCIVVIAAVSWLPFNIFNITIAYGADWKVSTFCFCHIIGLTSACANPILYGVFNDNFRTEFIAIFTILKIIPFCRAVRGGCRKALRMNDPAATEDDGPTTTVTRRNTRTDQSIVRRKETSANLISSKRDGSITALSPLQPLNNGTTRVETTLVTSVNAADDYSNFDTTVVSAAEENLLLCRRNFIVNGLHSKNYLLKSDLV